MGAAEGSTWARALAVSRIAWAITTLLVVEVLVCAIAALPGAAAWQWAIGATDGRPLARALVLSAVAVPSYAVFALGLMPVSALAMRLLGWRTPPGMEMRIADVGWPLLRWARYMASIHVVRVLAGGLLRGSPLWTAYLRWSGARIGRRVHIASVSLSDYNLLELGDNVVIGAGVHISGHTVERGIVKTASVRLAANVTIGVGTVVEIGADIGESCQVGALSFVPKYAQLHGGAVYAGIPVRRIDERKRA